MIIRDKSIRVAPNDITTIIKAENCDLEQTGDTFKMVHAQPIDDIVNEVQAFKSLDARNGFSVDRSVRKIATIPALEFAKHPEWATDTKALRKWLKTEGRMYMTVDKGV